MNSEPQETPEPGEDTPPEASEETSEAVRSPSRLHPSSMIFEAVKFVRSWASAAAIPGLAALFGSGLSVWVISLAVFGGVVLVAFSAVWGFLSWRATTYEMSGGAFYLRRGVFQKSERTIPLDHVQSVDTVQGFIQRVLNSTGLLDVVEVRIETAGGGSGETDASLSSLKRDDALTLRREIEDARREPVEGEEGPGPTVIRTLTTRELLIAGATSGQIGAAAAIIAFASQFLDNFIENLFSERFVEGVLQTIAPYAFVAVALTVLVVGLFAWFLAIAGTVLSYSGFTLSRSADGKYLNIKRGLIRRYEATVPISRIQAIRISEGLLRQPFGLAMLRVESAGYGAKAEDAGVSTTLFPLLPRRDALAFLREVAPEFAVEPRLTPLPRRALRRYLVRSVVPALLFVAVALVPLLATGLLSAFLFYYVGVSLALLVLSALYGRAAFRAAGWAVEGDCFVARSRALSRVTSVAPRRRLQSRSVVRSPFQRRLSLATVRARVASGSGGATFEVVDLESSSAEFLAGRLGPRRLPAN